MPRYPFTPELLDALPEELADLYRGLEAKMLSGICSRLKLTGQLNEVTVDYIRELQAHGISLEEIEAAILRETQIGQDKLTEMLDAVVARNQQYYSETVDLAGLTQPVTYVDQEAIWAIYEQTKGELRNLTRSMGFMVHEGRRWRKLSASEAYQWALDMAAAQVQTGAVSYIEAIQGAVKELAGNGMKTVDFTTGHVDSLDVAVRRAVLTGVNQINQKYRESSMDFLETDLVEVTAHLGARNTGKGFQNHAAWQGKVYRWREKPRASEGRYPDFVETCGLGDVQGIGGANCRHSYWPFIEGVSERTYTDEQLEGMKPENRKKTVFEGREYDDYQATQFQRKIEREIRRQRRLKGAYEAAGLEDDALSSKIRLRRLNAKYKAFSKTAGLKERPERMKVLYEDEKSVAAAEKLKPKREAEAVIRGAIKRGDYPLTINREKQARHMLGTAWPGRSVITISQDELQEIINSKAGSGSIRFKKGTYEWKHQEIIYAGREIGYTINQNGDTINTKSLKIHYSKTGVHAVPFSGWWKK